MTRPCPVTLTDAACQYFRRWVAGQEDGTVGVQVAVLPKGCSGLKYDVKAVQQRPEAGWVEEYDGFCLVVDEAHAALLADVTVDAMDVGMGQTNVVYHNPHAQHPCGCGESFNLVNDDEEVAG